jgi:hypothetical protein
MRLYDCNFADITRFGNSKCTDTRHEMKKHMTVDFDDIPNWKSKLECT